MVSLGRFMFSIVFALGVSLTIAIESPVGPSIAIYSLKVNGKTVGLLKGNANFKFSYEDAKTNTTIKDQNLSLDPSYLADVTGEQSATKTVFNILTQTRDAKPVPVRWSLTFVKDIKNNVKLTESVLMVNKTDLGAAEDIVVTWNKPVDIGTSANAYMCSNLLDVNGGDVMRIENVKIQPFDLKEGNFSEGVLCSQDQPRAGDWNVTQYAPKRSINYACIHMVGYVNLLINYTLSNNSNATANVPVPYTAQVVPEMSTCSFNFSANQVVGNEQTIQLKFVPFGAQTSKPWLLTLTFTNDSLYTGDKDNKTVVAYYVKLHFFYDQYLFPNIAASLLNTTSDFENVVNASSGAGGLSLFKAYSDRSYRCNANETTTVTDAFKLETSSLNVEAFMTNSTQFLTQHVCALDQQSETSDLIPIIIGAALAALVVVVLVAYLIGRARTRGSNYETI